MVTKLQMLQCVYTSKLDDFILSYSLVTLYKWNGLHDPIIKKNKINNIDIKKRNKIKE